jgi:aspartyl-tRNA(Asn)/glutamyl-tRNA(Gln) amidotransferase subunit A
MKKLNTAHEMLEALDEGEVSSVDLVEKSLSNIHQWEPHIRSFIEVLKNNALEQAKKEDSARKAGKHGRLSGIPIAIKDVICTKEGKTTAASKILANFSSPYDATVIKRLKKAGAIIISKANLDEFAMGASNEYSAFGPTLNPWDTTRVAGGSSGGPAAAVASSETPLSLGTDTGGSIRLPASFCNVVGLKPTYGRVSRFGVIAYASSFDQVGPFARTVKDAALLFEIIAGHDPNDATSSSKPIGDYAGACNQSIKGLTVGIPDEYFNEDVDSSIVETVNKAIANIKSLGANIKKISLPLTAAAIPTYYLLAKAEASTNLARYDGLRYGAVKFDSKDLINRYLETRGKYFGPEVKRTILMGTYALSAGYYDAWYKQASKVRTLIRQEFAEAFKNVDVIAGPVSPELPFTLNSKTEDPLTMYLADALTTTASVAGLPAMSVPCGFSNNLPIGLQLIAPHFQEERIFKTAYAYEQSEEWHKKTPTLPA